MKFRLHKSLAASAAVAFAILCALGVWQLRRLEWKEGLIDQTTARLSAAPIPFDAAIERESAGENMEYQPVFVDGVYAHDLKSSVFGTYDGAAGVYVFTPFDAADGGRRFVYVNRGFVPQAMRDAVSAPAGEVRVEGLFRRAEEKRGLAKWLQPEDQLTDNLYFIRDPAVLAARHSLDVPPFYIDSSGKESAGAWPKGGVTRIDFPNRHLEYALTWFALAAALAGVFVAYSVKRES